MPITSIPLPPNDDSVRCFRFCDINKLCVYSHKRIVNIYYHHNLVGAITFIKDNAHNAGGCKYWPTPSAFYHIFLHIKMINISLYYTNNVSVCRKNDINTRYSYRVSLMNLCAVLFEEGGGGMDGKYYYYYAALFY